MILKKIHQKELIDDFSIIDSRIDEALDELAFINRFLGGTSVTREGIKILAGRIPKADYINILDIGSGGSDDLLNQKLIFPGNIFAVDKNRRACLYLKGKNKNINVLCGDIFKMPLNSKKFDIIHASLFLHHLIEEENIILLKSLIKHSKYGIIINDLRRSLPAYIGIKLLCRFFFKSSLVKNDAPVSVRRGFTKNELKSVLKKAGADKFIIKRKWAFRWLIIIFTN